MGMMFSDNESVQGAPPITIDSFPAAMSSPAGLPTSTVPALITNSAASDNAQTSTTSVADSDVSSSFASTPITWSSGESRVSKPPVTSLPSETQIASVPMSSAFSDLPKKPPADASPNSFSAVPPTAQSTEFPSGSSSNPSPAQPTPGKSKKTWAICIGIMLPILFLTIVAIAYRRYCRRQRTLTGGAFSRNTNYGSGWAERWVVRSSSMLFKDTGTEIRETKTTASYPRLLQLTPNASTQTLPSSNFTSRSRRSSVSSTSAPWKHIVPRASTDSSGGSSIYVYDDSIRSRHDLSSLRSHS
jgi:hypothetical protein